MAWLVATVVLAGLPAGGASARVGQQEHLVQTVVPLPSTVTRVEFPSYTDDGRRVLAGAQSSAFAGTQIVSFREDGSGFTCLSCGAWSGPALTKPAAFPDGRRVLVRVGDQTPFSPADHGVLECLPSLLDCRGARVLPIEVPSAGDPNVVQDQREFRVSPDGVHVAFTQIRRSASGRETGAGIVGRLVRDGARYRVTGPRVVATDGELKGFTPDGGAVTFARFLGAFEAGNPDDVAVDLATGRESRLTWAPDWDEDVDLSPARYRGRDWLVAGSARGAGLLEAVAQVRRPTAIELGLSALPFVVFRERGPQIAEPWLVAVGADRTGDLGRPLAPGANASGWDSRAVTRWKPDGTAVVFWQRRIDGEGTRVIVVRLADRRPACPPRPARSPVPRWAPPLAGYVPDDPPLPRSRRGRVSGRMVVTTGPSPVQGFGSGIEVRYLGFSDERGLVLDGVERAGYTVTGFLYGNPSVYDADVVVSGRHRGWLRASGVPIGPGGVGGTIESQLDGRRVSLGPLP